MTEATHLLLVPHTHWDREWYLTFQQFRMKLVHTVDKVLDVLEADSSFTHFMLDGQTIVLDDYLEIRPENAERLQQLARQGRVLVGPWYLQPDEFLVGGESLVRNLQIGKRMGEAYGGVMPIGYVPDTFGHIAQLPQILRGFGLDNVIFWRGVGPEIERGPFQWTAPDGSDVLVIWLHDDFGYSNAALLPLDVDALTARVDHIVSRMRPRTGLRTLLLMNGSDHLDPQDGLPALLRAASEHLREHGLDAAIGTLPQYVEIVKEERPPLATYSGEMRSSYRAHLLPGVLSTRMWLKQRNAAGEALLTRWAEPMTAWAATMGDTYPSSLLALSWKFLLQNHPHDSICGCGIDAVHREMLPRFEQSEQIAQELTKRALEHLVKQVDTRSAEQAVPFVVFNPATGPRTDVVRCDAQLPFSNFDVVDAEGHVLAYQPLATHAVQLFDQEVDKNLVLAGIGMATEGRALGYVLMDARLGLSEKPGEALVELTISEHGEPDPELLERAKAQAFALASREDITSFRVIAREAKHTELLVLPRDVPAFGGRVIAIRPRGDENSAPEHTNGSFVHTVRANGTTLENAHLRVSADPATGTLSLHDKRTGRNFAGLNRVADSGDVGDLYTYCPPASDTVVMDPSQAPEIDVIENGPARATLRIIQHYELPIACTEARDARSTERVACAVVSDVSLVAGAQRVEIRTEVENRVRDHRLRVLFPVPFAAEYADAEGVFEVTRRPARQPQPSADQAADWAELPVDTHPQKRFVAVSNGEYGLAVLNRGLPEYEVLPPAGDAGSAIALTLLRCTEWLSREDLTTRRGHAGPMISTPEAQGEGKHVFEYALVPHNGDWHAEDALVLREAQAFELPMRAIPTEQHAGRLHDMWSFVHVAPESVIVSAIKRAEREDALVVRLVNPLGEPVTTEVILALPFTEARVVDLNEDEVPDADAGDLARILNTGVRLRLRGGEIKTLIFRMQ